MTIYLTQPLLFIFLNMKGVLHTYKQLVVDSLMNRNCNKDLFNWQFAFTQIISLKQGNALMTIFAKDILDNLHQKLITINTYLNC